MTYHPKKIAIAGPSLSIKTASLFFQHVFPYYVGAWQSPEGRVPLEKLLPPTSGFEKLVPRESPAFDLLLPQSGGGFDESEKYSYLCYKAFEMMMLAGFLSSKAPAEQDRETIEATFRTLTELFGRKRAGLMRNHVDDMETFRQILLQYVKYALPFTDCEAIDGQSSAEFRDSLEGADPCFVLANVEVVDADRLTWEQILAIREDSESSKRLRNLRTFVFEEFNGKPITYIEDKLGVLMDEYRAAAQLHGAALKKAALSVVSSEKILTGASAGLLAAVTGSTMPIATAIGAVAALGSCLLEVRAIRQKAKTELALSPVRYLIDIDNKVDRNQRN